MSDFDPQPSSMPSHGDYCLAVQQGIFNDEELKACQPEVMNTAYGISYWAGNFGIVFRLQSTSSKKVWAVKCFTHKKVDLLSRYRKLDGHLESFRKGRKYFMQFDYQEEGIGVNGRWYPIVKMEWVEGKTLDKFIQDCLDKPDWRKRIQKLAQLWYDLACDLEECQIAHGDLAHDNVLVIEDDKTGEPLQLKLVDYDGVCVPALRNKPSDEEGKANYQHPRREYGMEMDRFPLLSIYLSLRALAAHDKSLWEKHHKDDALIFAKRDYESPDDSEIIRELRKSSDRVVRLLTEHLVRAAQAPPDQTPRLRDIVRRKRRRVVVKHPVVTHSVNLVTRAATSLTHRMLRWLRFAVLVVLLSMPLVLALGVVSYITYQWPPSVKVKAWAPDPPIIGEPWEVQLSTSSPLGRNVHIEWRRSGEAVWHTLDEPVVRFQQVGRDSIILEFRAVDERGFKSRVWRYEWKPRALPPVVEITGTTPLEGPILGEPFTVRLNAHSPRPRRQVRVEWRRAGDRAWQPCENQLLQFPLVTDRELRLEFRAVDDLGSTSPTLQRTWQTLVFRPELHIVATEPQDGPIASEPFVISLQASHPRNHPVTLYWRGAGQTNWQRLERPELRLSEVGREELILEFSAQDRFGIESAIVPARWQPRIVVPTVKLTGTRPKAGPVADTLFELHFETASLIGRRVWVEWRSFGEETWNRVQGGTLSLTVPKVSNFTIEYRAVDEKGYNSEVQFYSSQVRPREIEIHAHQGSVHDLVFSSDARLLATGGKDSTIRVWDWPHRVERHNFSVSKAEMYRLAFTTDDRWLIYGDSNGEVWACDTRSERRIWLQSHEEPIWSMAVTPDGRHVIWGTTSGMVSVWRSGYFQKRYNFRPHNWVVSGLVAFQYQGTTWVASCSYDRTIRVWNLETQEECPYLAEQDAPLRCLAATRNRSWLVVGSMDGSLLVLDWQKRKLIHALSGHKAGLATLLVDPEGKFAISAAYDNTIRIWDLIRGRELRCMELPVPVVSLALSIDGMFLAMGRSDGVVHVRFIGDLLP